MVATVPSLPDDYEQVTNDQKLRAWLIDRSATTWFSSLNLFDQYSRSPETAQRVLDRLFNYVKTGQLLKEGEKPSPDEPG